MTFKTLALVPGLFACLLNGLAANPATLPTLDKALASKQDLWGLAAMRQPNGPSHKFFAGLLPPLLQPAPELDQGMANPSER